MTMLNREVYSHDPIAHDLLNNGVAEVKDTGTAEELKTLHYELSTFVCDGQYEAGLQRILESYNRNLGKPEQPAAWVSGFYGSGKSHLVKMLRALWSDTPLPGGATARGVAKLPTSVSEALIELSTAGKRFGGLHAAAGTLGAGAGDHARTALLSIVFRSVQLPEQYWLARFVMRLRDKKKLEEVRGIVEAQGEDWEEELRNLHVSPVIAEALVQADAGFGSTVDQVQDALHAQYPAGVEDVSNEEMVRAIEDALTREGQFPCTLIALDEVQQYINEMGDRTRVIQEIAETCSKRLGGKVLFVATGQSGLQGTPQLERLQDRFRVRVHLTDEDVETVIRTIVLRKKPEAQAPVEKLLETHSGEIERHLAGTKLSLRPEDRQWMVADYPLLPTRRRFWEKALRAVDQAGTQGQLRNQLKTVHEAARATAEDPLGTVVGGDFLYEQQAVSLLQTGALSSQVHEFIEKHRAGSDDDRLKARLVALIFLIGKLPRQTGVDLGVRAIPDMLADLLVTDLGAGSSDLRRRIPGQLDKLEDMGQVMKVEGEYRLQTAEGAEWEREYRNRFNALKQDQTKLGPERGQLLIKEAEQRIGKIRVLQGRSKFPREAQLHFGAAPPDTSGSSIPVWVRDGWSDDEKSFWMDARRAGEDDPTIFVWIPRRSADDLARVLAVRRAARETLELRGMPSTTEGREARSAIQSRETEAELQLQELTKDIFAEAIVVQAAGQEVGGKTLHDRVLSAAENALIRLFPQFSVADHTNWAKVIERARNGSGDPLEVVGHKGETDKHEVTSTILSYVAGGRTGAAIRKHFDAPPYGWPADAVDGALYALLGTGHLRAELDYKEIDARSLDRRQAAKAEFSREHVVATPQQKMAVRRLLTDAGVAFTPNQEAAAIAVLLTRMEELSRAAGGEPPLPERPGTQHVEELKGRQGNDLIVAVAEVGERLGKDADEWKARAGKAEKRLQRWRRLQELLGYADGLDGVNDVQRQTAAIRDQRQLLADPDPVDPQLGTLVELLRGAVTYAQSRYATVFEQELSDLEASEDWQALDKSDRATIRGRYGLQEVPEARVGTETELLESLSAVSLSDWADRTDALPQRFQQARLEAAKRRVPESVSVSLPKTTLRNEEELEQWLDEVRTKIRSAMEDGQAVIV